MKAWTIDFMSMENLKSNCLRPEFTPLSTQESWRHAAISLALATENSNKRKDRDFPVDDHHARIRFTQLCLD